MLSVHRHCSRMGFLFVVVEIESKSSHMLGQVSVAKLFNSGDQAEAAGYRVV